MTKGQSLRLTLCLATCLSIASGAPLFGAVGSTSFYVSPTGSDANPGTKSAPFQTLQRAEQELAKVRSGTVYLMDGVFAMTETLVLIPSVAEQSWKAAPGANPVLDGRGRLSDAVEIRANNVTIDGLTIRRFTGSGIAIRSGSNIVIRENRFLDINSTGWNQAAILGYGSASNVSVLRNDIRNVNYAGIEFAGPVNGSALSGIKIVGNRIFNSCRSVRDCGAILVNGRSQTTSGAIISENYIRDYGPPQNQTKGIYLDDYLSNSTVTNNQIHGNGSYAIQIHGGRGNIIAHNIISVPRNGKALLYQAIDDSRGSDMSGNRFEHNDVRGASDDRDVASNAGHGRLPNFRGNKYDGARVD